MNLKVYVISRREAGPGVLAHRMVFYQSYMAATRIGVTAAAGAYAVLIGDSAIDTVAPTTGVVLFLM